MIYFFLALLPHVVEVLKYRSFIQNHFFIPADILSGILFILGLVNYYKSNKNRTNYLFLVLFCIFSGLHLELKYLDRIYYPNYVYSTYGIDWGPLGNISQLLMMTFVATEFLKKYGRKTVSTISSWVAGVFRSNTAVKYSALILVAATVIWLPQANKILYNRQLDLLEYFFLNHAQTSRETYIRSKSTGDFYTEMKSLKSRLGNDFRLFIPPQSSDWPYAGNVPFIRGIIYPAGVFHYQQADLNTVGSDNYLLVTCGYKFNNMGKCFPENPAQIPLGGEYYLVNSKGQITPVATASPDLIRNTENLIIARLK